MKQRIEKKLKDNLTILKLEVKNQSYLHSGHAGDNGSGDTHFEVTILAKELEGKSRIQSHRIINNLLKDEFEKNGLHALAIKIS